MAACGRGTSRGLGTNGTDVDSIGRGGPDLRMLQGCASRADFECRQAAPTIAPARERRCDGARRLHASGALQAGNLFAGTLFPRTYQTSIGETRSFHAARDGSVVTLDTDSRMRVRYRPSRRNVELTKANRLLRREARPNRDPRLCRPH